MLQLFWCHRSVLKFDPQEKKNCGIQNCCFKMKKKKRETVNGNYKKSKSFVMTSLLKIKFFQKEKKEIFKQKKNSYCLNLILTDVYFFFFRGSFQRLKL